jgi:hypothetical protein
VRLAVAAALVALALAGCGTDDADEASGPATVTVTETETVVEEPTTTAEIETQPASECSTSGLRVTLPDQDLPAPVAETRQEIFDAAVACDYDTLEQLASEEGFTFSYGAETDASDYWRGLEESGEEPKPMRALAAILTLPVTRNEAGSYAWPSAYDESPTAADWLALAHTGLYSEEQLEQMRTQGTGYLGYRTAITPEGEWQFFVAGD